MEPDAGGVLVGAAALIASLWSTRVVAQTSAGDRGDSVVYRLTPASRLEVKTGKAGLLGSAGHEHLIRACTFSGRVVYYPRARLASPVEIAIATTVARC